LIDLKVLKIVIFQNFFAVAVIIIELPKGKTSLRIKIKCLYGGKRGHIMSKTITNAMLLEAINNINKSINSLEKRVATLEGSKSKPTVSSKGNAEETTEETTATTYSTDIKDYEPKLDKGGKKGEYNWTSYNSNRTKYSYAVATNGGCINNGYGTEWYGKIDYDKYKTAKAEFEKAYPRISKPNR
jgi:hypothetical protein